ncbi:MAG: hypothetical protein ACI4K5_00960 [Ruminococcus sp.]
MLKKYRFSFDISGLVIFLIVMIPNFIWFVVPAPNDILRNESITTTVDTIGSIFQAIFIGSLCIIINKERNKLHFSPLIIFSIICIAIYFVGWILYYNSITNALVIISLTLPPCLAFIFFALDRKNIIAVVFDTCFTICHLIYGVVNFIL